VGHRVDVGAESSCGAICTGNLARSGVFPQVAWLKPSKMGRSQMMIRLLYITCGVIVQKDWMNGVDTLRRAHVWYDGQHFWVEQTEALPVPRKGESRFITALTEGYEAAEPVPARWNELLRTQMGGYRLVQTGEDVWCSDV
jgi:hypothetical protein